jgi:hypothetical protein
MAERAQSAKSDFRGERISLVDHDANGRIFPSDLLKNNEDVAK